MLVGCSGKRAPSATDHPAPPSSSAPRALASASASTATLSHSAVAAASARPSAEIDVVSSASPYVAAEGPALLPTGKVDGAEHRRKFLKRLSEDQSPVTVLEGGTPLELGERLCQEVVPQRPKDTRILIKPNMGGFEWFKDPAKSAGDDGLVGRTTDPEFVRGIVRCLKARGHYRITVAEGWGARHADWIRLANASGYQAMADQEGVPLVAMDDDGFFDVQGERPGQPLAVTGMQRTTVPTLLMPRILAEHLESGLYISAPKIKAHRFAVASIGLKSAQGTVMLSDGTPAFHQKWRMHRELSAALEARKQKDPKARELYVKSLEIFAERIADVLEVAGPHVVLAEGAPMVGGDGFARHWPSAESVAIGGTQLVWVDRIGLELLGLWKNAALSRELLGHATSPLLEVAARRWKLDIKSPPVRGSGAELLGKSRPVHFVGMAGFEIHSDGAKPAAAALLTRSEGVRPSAVPSSAPSVPPAPAAAAASVSPVAPPLAQSGAWKPGKNPTLHARRASSPPHLDGAADDVLWQGAPTFRFDTDYSGAHTGIFTSVKVAWDPQALYVLWDLEGSGFHTDQSRPIGIERAKLYQEDCTEIFLTPDANQPNRYFEVEVGPFGHFFDLSVDRTSKHYDTDWSSHAEIATHRDLANHRAIVEVALRAEDLVRALGPEKVLPVGLFRMEGSSPRQYLAASPPRTPKPNFHVPEAFAALVLDP